MLLKDLDSKNGLVKGARLIVEKMGADSLRCRPVDSRSCPKEVLLKPELFEPTEGVARFTRRQFPIRLAFAMTCKRYIALRQAFDVCGLVLTEAWHGKLELLTERRLEDLYVYDATEDPSLTNDLLARISGHNQQEPPVDVPDEATTYLFNER